MIKSSNQSGFTLVELVIVLAVFAILLVGLLGLFDWHARIYSLEQADVRATSSARTAFNNMSEYIAQSTYVVAWRTIGSTTYISDSDTLVIEMPTLGSSGNYIPATYDYVVYYLSNGNLYQVSDFDSNSVRKENTKILAEKVQTFSITYNDDDPTLATTVNIDLQTSVPVRGTSSAVAHLNDTILLRNHP